VDIRKHRIGIPAAAFLIAALLGAAIGAPGPAAPAATPKAARQDQSEFWSHPMAASAYMPQSGVDFKDIFNHPELWAAARKFPRVFFFYEFNIMSNSAAQALNKDELRKAISFLNGQGIQIGTEDGAVKDWGGDGTLEADYTIRNIALVRRLGGEIRYIKMDEPLECGMNRMGMSLNQALQGVITYVNRVKAHEDDVIIGDIEPYPALRLGTLLSWIAAFGDETGADFPFFLLDIDFAAVRRWDMEDIWQDEVVEIRKACQERGIRFGVIFWSSNYIKTETELSSDYDFYSGATAFADRYVSALGVPEIFLVQSWRPFPRYNLPDDAGFSFLQLVRELGGLYFASPAQPPFLVPGPDAPPSRVR